MRLKYPPRPGQVQTYFLYRSTEPGRAGDESWHLSWTLTLSATWLLAFIGFNWMSDCLVNTTEGPSMELVSLSSDKARRHHTMKYLTNNIVVKTVTEGWSWTYVTNVDILHRIYHNSILNPEMLYNLLRNNILRFSLSHGISCIRTMWLFTKIIIKISYQNHVMLDNGAPVLWQEMAVCKSATVHKTYIKLYSLACMQTTQSPHDFLQQFAAKNGNWSYFSRVITISFRSWN